MRLWIPDCLPSCEAAAAWVRGAALMNGIDLGLLVETTALGFPDDVIAMF